MMSPVQPPGKRARSEVGENITAVSVIKKEMVEEEEEEMHMEDLEVEDHLRVALEAAVGDIWRSVSAWKEKEIEKEKQNNYLRDLLVKTNMKEREGLEDTINQLKEEVDKEKCRKKQFEEVLKDFASEVTSLRNESVKFEDEIARLKKTESAAAEILDGMRDDNECMRKEKDSLIADLKREILEKESKVKESSEALAKEIVLRDSIVDKQKEKLVKMQQLFKEQMARKDSLVENLQKKIEESETISRKNENVIKFLQAEVKEKEKLDQEARSLKGQLAGKDSRIQDLRNSNDNNIKKLQEKEKTLKILNEKLLEERGLMKAGKVEWDQVVNMCKSRNTKLEEENIQLKQRLTERDASTEKLNEELNSEKKKRISNEVLLDETQGQAKRLQDSIGTLRESANKAVAEKEETIKNLQQKLQSAKIREDNEMKIKSLEKKVKELETDIELHTLKEEKAKSELDNLNSTLNKANEDLNKANEDLNKANEDLNKANEDLKKVNEELNKANEEKQKLRQEVEFQKKRHLSNARINELQQSLDEKGEIINAQVKKIAAMEKAIEAYMECLAEDGNIFYQSVEKINNLVHKAKKGLRSKLDGGHDVEEQSKLASQTAEEIPQIGKEIEIEMMEVEPNANEKPFEKNIESESGNKSQEEKVKVAEMEDKVINHQSNMDLLEPRFDESVPALIEIHRSEVNTLKRDLDQGAWELFANIFEIESSAKRIQSESKFARDELEAKLEDEKKKLVNTLSLQEEAKKQHNAALDNLRLEMRAKYDRIRHLEGKVTEKELQVGNLQVNVVIIDTQVK